MQYNLRLGTVSGSGTSLAVPLAARPPRSTALLFVGARTNLVPNTPAGWTLLGSNIAGGSPQTSMAVFVQYAHAAQASGSVTVTYASSVTGITATAECAVGVLPTAQQFGRVRASSVGDADTVSWLTPGNPLPSPLGQDRFFVVAALKFAGGTTPVGPWTQQLLIRESGGAWTARPPLALAPEYAGTALNGHLQVAYGVVPATQTTPDISYQLDPASYPASSDDAIVGALFAQPLGGDSVGLLVA